MPMLTVLKGRRFEKEFSFDKDHLFLGREEGNDLVLPDSSISRVHAKFVKDPSGWSIADLNSTNGVYINNAKVTETPVKDGDILVVGEYTLFFRQDPKVPARATASGGNEAFETLDALFDLTRHLRSDEARNQTLEVMLDALISIFQAERGLILEVDPESGEVGEATLECLSGEAREEAPVSKTVARRVVEEGKPILITDVEADFQLKGVESIETDQVRSIIGAPLEDVEGRICGVVYLDSEVKIRVFTEEDLRMLDRFLEHASGMIAAYRQSFDLVRENQRLATIVASSPDGVIDPHEVIGSSPPMLALKEQIEDVSAEDVTTLLTGESGTGKELVAKAIHHKSRRKEKPFVALNLMAVPKDLIESELFGHEKGAFSGAHSRKIGKLELAEGGTLFLDEVGELSLEIQVKLLRALEERKVCRIGGNEEIDLDIRLISATNRDLKATISEGRFREDLYYRINVFNLDLPPLRDRREDIARIAQHFVELFNRKMGKAIRGVSAPALELMAAYDWPGNIRELRNVIERAFVVEKQLEIQPTSLPFAVEDTSPRPDLENPFVGLDYPQSWEQAQEYFEKSFIVESLKRHGGNITQTSKISGLPRRTLYRKLEKYGIDPKDLITEDLSEEELLEDK